MFDLHSPINKGQILQIRISLQPLQSSIDYHIGYLSDVDFTRFGDGNIHLNKDETIELLQTIQGTTNLQQIKQALEDFLVLKLNE